MIGFFPSHVTISPEILQLLEGIARKNGELGTIRRDVRIDAQIESIATVDAVHFSTKIEGNKLTRDQVARALGSKKVRLPRRDLKEVLNYSRARKIVREWALKG